MAYRKGDPIAAADINSFVSSVANVFGVGNGDSGYGRTSPALLSVVQGVAVRSEEWATLRSVIALCAAHQGTSAALLPPSSLLAVGQRVVAHEQDPPSSNAYDLDGMIAAITTNRLTLSPTNAALVPSVATSVRVSPWGSGAATTITFTADCTWPTEDQTRYFFNTGGSLQVTLSHTSTGFAKDNLWSSGLSALDAVRMGARSTIRTGSVGTATDLGYYTLTDNLQTAFDGTNIIQGFGGPGNASTYGITPVNDVLVQARRLHFAGLRGGNGRGVRIVVSLTDDIPGGPDVVSAGTTANFGYRYATSFSGIPLPSVNAV